MTRAEAERFVGKINGATNIVTQALSGASAAIGSAYLFALGYALKLVRSNSSTLRAAAENIRKETGIDGMETIAAVRAQPQRASGPREPSYDNRTGNRNNRPDFLLSADELREREIREKVSNSLQAALTPLETTAGREIVDLPVIRYFDQQGKRLPKEEVAKMIEARDVARKNIARNKATALKMAEEALQSVKQDAKTANHIIVGREIGEIAHEATAEARAAGGIKAVLTSPIRAFKSLPASGKALMAGVMAAAGIGGYLYQRHKNRQIDAKMKPEMDQAIEETYGSKAAAGKPVVGQYTAQLAEENAHAPHLGRS